MSHRLTIKGQVTIPKEIRDLLGLVKEPQFFELCKGYKNQ